MKDTKNLQKKLFDEIEGRIKLDDQSLPYKDKRYEYWTKTTKEGNYYKKLRAQARKLTSSQAPESQASNLPSKAQASSLPSQGPGSKIQGTSVPSPYPGNKQQE